MIMAETLRTRTTSEGSPSRRRRTVGRPDGPYGLRRGGRVRARDRVASQLRTDPAWRSSRGDSEVPGGGPRLNQNGAEGRCGRHRGGGGVRRRGRRASIAPGLGRFGPAEWQISGGHLAETSHMFLIVTLGESILITGTGSVPPIDPPERRHSYRLRQAVALWWRLLRPSVPPLARSMHRCSRQIRADWANRVYLRPHPDGGRRIIVAGRRDGNSPSRSRAGTRARPRWQPYFGGPELFLAGHRLFKK